MTPEKLIELAKDAMTRAYAPYSGYKVGAALLAKSGKVSSANGVIDASGYFLASVANAIFSGFMGKVGWRGIITLWCLIMLLGAIIAGIKKAHIRKQAFNNQE